MNEILPQNLPETPQSSRYFNRELSWLDFNHRVLEEALATTTPCLERIKFIAIAFANLDEFFMVRVAGLKRAIAENLKSTDSPDSTIPTKVLQSVTEKTRELIRYMYLTVYKKGLKYLEQRRIRITKFTQLNAQQQSQLNDYYYNSVCPVLTPLAVDSAHPFPFLSNRRLYLLITFITENQDLDYPPMAFVEIPEVLPRLLEVKTDDPGEHLYILLEDLVAQNLDSLFLGFYIEDVFPIRVTRDLDFTLLENDVVDLLQSVQKEVKNREQARAVRLEVSQHITAKIAEYLRQNLHLHEDDIYRIPGPLNLNYLKTLYDLPHPELKEAAFNPRLPPALKSTKAIFSIIKEQDLLIHHPYESFYAIIEFLNAAASDPNVLAIKQTLYRTSGDSPIINALIRAAENGKHVTAVVELKARFDEKNNMTWSREMERSGVNVVFGFIGLKIHGKTTLVVRREGEVIRRYVHLSTGNYNSETAKSYVDLGLLTADADISHDISTLFNLLTGFNIFTRNSAVTSGLIPQFRKIAVAPLSLRHHIIESIRTETEASKEGKGGHIIAKMNALVDRDIIEELYHASQLGVKIELIVRGICCLKPGVPGLSDNITVISIIDRFLEHSRIYYFRARGQKLVFLSSADWMTRNMDRRVEILFPVLCPENKRRLIEEILPGYLRDNFKARKLNSDGSYERLKPQNHSSPERVQNHFIELARQSGIKSLPYEHAIRNKKKNGKTIVVLPKDKDKP